MHGPGTDTQAGRFPRGLTHFSTWSKLKQRWIKNRASAVQAAVITVLFGLVLWRLPLAEGFVHWSFDLPTRLAPAPRALRSRSWGDRGEPARRRLERCREHVARGPERDRGIARQRHGGCRYERAVYLESVRES